MKLSLNDYFLVTKVDNATLFLAIGGDSTRYNLKKGNIYVFKMMVVYNQVNNPFFLFLEIIMPSKKSAFVVFLDCYRSEEINKGNKVPKHKELAIKLSPIWNVSNLCMKSLVGSSKAF